MRAADWAADGWNFRKSCIDTFSSLTTCSLVTSQRSANPMFDHPIRIGALQSSWLPGTDPTDWMKIGMLHDRSLAHKMKRFGKKKETAPR